jgi:hypothetical protein
MLASALPQARRRAGAAAKLKWSFVGTKVGKQSH